MPDWALWFVIWWAAWFLVLLTWYEKNKKEPLTVLTCVFMFFLAGAIPVYILAVVIRLLKRK